MSVDRANRSLAAMLALAGALSSVVALVGCCAFGALTYRVRTGGIVSLSTTGTQATLVLCVLVTGGMVLAIHGIRRQVRATQRLGRRVRRHILAAVPDALSVAAQHVGLDGRVDVIDAEEPCAFTWGLLRPRVAVSRALVEQMQSGELEAVLEHEHYHVVNFDAAKVFAARSVPMAFFYVPVLGFLRDRYLTARELRGDAFTDDEKVRNFAYYEQLTVRDSSLSANTQAVIAAETGHRSLAYDYLAETALIDLDDFYHNTRDGLHLAALAGTWIALVNGFGGMRTHNG